MPYKRKRSEVDTPCDSLQAMMEKVVDNLHPNDKKIFQHRNGEFLPVRQWKGLFFNSHGEIVAIAWHNLFQEKGTILFSYLPASVETFVASRCRLAGSVSFADFPDGLKWLDLSDNNIHIDLNQQKQELKLLRSIERLYLGKSHMQSILALSDDDIPESLRACVNQMRICNEKSTGKSEMADTFLWVHENGTSKCFSWAEKESFTQQFLMEQVVSQMSRRDKAIFQNPSGVFLPIDLWKGIKVDKDKNVIEIDWSGLCEEDTILSFKWLPASVESFDASNCQLFGRLILKELPRQLKILALSCNNLVGELKLEHLPPAIRVVRLRENNFSGQLNMRNLPEHLEELHLDHNFFHGQLELRNLPENLTEVCLQKNQFSAITIEKLPNERTTVDVRENPLEGEVLKNRSM